MRILCDGFGWFKAAAHVARERHDVRELPREALAAAWEAGAAPDWWRDHVPAGWEPDVALFQCPEYLLAPPRLGALPCPVALWVGDWYVGGQAVRWLAAQADLLLADAVGARALRAAGLEHVDECCPWTFDPALHRADPAVVPDIDVGFAGSLNDAIQHERNRWLARVADLDPSVRVTVAAGAFGEDYVKVLQRSKLTFNVSVTGDVNMRCFEAAACGSLVLVDAASAPEVGRWFALGEEVAVYDEHDLEQVVAGLLADEPRRAAMAAAGHARVQQHAPAPRLLALLDRLERLAAEGRTRRSTGADPLADGLPAACQLLSTVHQRPPMGGAEIVLEAAEQAAPDDAAVQTARGVLYLRHATVVRDTAAAAVGWAAEHFDRAIALDPRDGVARFGRLQLAVATADHAAARALALAIVEDLDAGRLDARPDRLPALWTASRVRVLWQQAVLAGAGLEAVLRTEALRLGAEATRDPYERVVLLRAAAEASGGERPELHQALATALLATGDAGDAAAHAETAARALPLRVTPWVTQVEALRVAGRHAEASEVAREVQRLAERLPPLVPAAARVRELVAA